MALVSGVPEEPHPMVQQGQAQEATLIKEVIRYAIMATTYQNCFLFVVVVEVVVAFD